MVNDKIGVEDSATTNLVVRFIGLALFVGLVCLGLSRLAARSLFRLLAKRNRGQGNSWAGGGAGEGVSRVYMIC